MERTGKGRLDDGLEAGHRLREGRGRAAQRRAGLAGRRPLPVRITRQAVERPVVRPHAGVDPLRPIVVELHVALVGQDRRRVRGQVEHAYPHEERTSENEEDWWQGTPFCGEGNRLGAHVSPVK